MADLFGSMTSAAAVGDRVRVHLSLNAVKTGRPRWSISVKGRVVDHVRHVVLKDVTFVVHEGTRQRVIAKRCREVHAWAVGTLVASAPRGDSEAISYSPYRAGTFTTRDGRAVVRCDYVEFSEGAVALGIVEG